MSITEKNHKLKNATIMIVDDEPINIDVVQVFLEECGYTKFITVADSTQALVTIEKTNPDLLLLDLMMPQKSGISLLSDLKKDADLQEIPVIMVTGVSGETGIDLESFFQRSSTAGENDGVMRPQGFIEKPVDPEKLLRLVKKALE